MPITDPGTLDWIDERTENVRLREQVAQLQQFARKLFDAADWPEGGDIGADELQDAAVECGLLMAEIRNSPCSDDQCFCGEFYGPESFRYGITCYRKVGWLLDMEKQSND